MTLYDTKRTEITKEPSILVRLYLTSGQYLFSEKNAPLFPAAFPYVESYTTLGQELKENLTLNSKVTVTFYDDFFDDGSSWWRKRKVIDYNYNNRIIEIKKGFTGLSEADYLTVFKGFISNIQITEEGKVLLTAKGLLRLTDVEIPQPSDAKLGQDLAAGDTSAIILQSGADLSLYSQSGYVKIDNEIIYYGGKSGDTLTGLIRGNFNGDGWDMGSIHTAGAVVNQVKVYNGVHPVDVIYDLLVSAGLSTSDINTASFNYVKDNWLAGQAVRTVLSRPSSVKNYLRELKEVFFLSLWQGEDQLIHMSFLGPKTPSLAYKKITDKDNIIFRSMRSDDNEDTRITRVRFFYNLNGSKDGSDHFDYKNQTVVIDSAAESVYREQKMFTVMSRWLRSDLGAETLCRWIGINYTRMFKAGKKTIIFEAEMKDDDLQPGDVFKLTTSYILNQSGAPENEVKFLIVQKEQTGINKVRYKAVDTRLTKKYSFTAPSSSPDYLQANEDQRDYAFISNNAGMMLNGDLGYSIF